MLAKLNKMSALKTTATRIIIIINNTKKIDLFSTNKFTHSVVLFHKFVHSFSHLLYFVLMCFCFASLCFICLAFRTLGNKIIIIKIRIISSYFFHLSFFKKIFFTNVLDHLTRKICERKQ